MDSRMAVVAAVEMCGGVVNGMVSNWPQLKLIDVCD